jgi:1-deoxy-D-xylulose-5-phosphate reductoisomerase
MSVQRVAILGSTGSIGTNALRVVREHPGWFQVTGLAAGRNVALLAEQVREFRPARVAVADAEAARALRQAVGSGCPPVGAGEEAVCEVAAAPGTDRVVAAMVGAAGIRPVLRALEAGHDVALANKEALVVAGELMTAAARRLGAALLPVDSEHNAVHQCLRSGSREEVRRVVLTASGGPFRDRPLDTFDQIRVEEALRHPTWTMGRKVTIDSATLMNKGLELIEARWLFDLAPGQIDVLIHPQSLVHSLVEYVDGFYIAQMATPDMGLPIQYAMTYPQRWPTRRERLDLARAGALEFHEPDPRRYPCLALAREALGRGGTHPAALNAADEVVVEEFLAGRLPFTGMARVLERVMERWDGGPAPDLETLLAADREARRRALEAAGRARAARCA